METNKELLLKDLCSRLPYGVKAQYYCIDEEDTMYDTIDSIYVIGNGTVEVGIGQYGLNIEDIKPYLFPLSSMTEEQYNELGECLCMDINSVIEYNKKDIKCAIPYFNVLNWYNTNHFDYRGLIEKGFALNATGLDIY